MTATVVAPARCVYEPGGGPTATGVLGGKALGLLSIAEAGLDTPPWFAVLPSALDAGGSLRGAARSDIAEACRRLEANGATAFAVRSSAADEDGTGRSFAGQYHTFLDVRGIPAVLDAIQRVATLPASGGLAAYRATHGEASADRAPSIIVQEFVQPVTAGVAFSRDPLSGGDEVVITATRIGSGTLSSGETTGDEYRVSTRELVSVRHRAAADRVLSDDRALTVARAVRLLERGRGAPQDVEWAYPASGGLKILQTRPITALPGTHLGAEQVRLWDNANIVESFPDLTLPLTFSIAVELYADVYRQACRALGVPRAVVEREADLFEQMLGLLEGRVYYNLTSWYRVLALLPGFGLTSGFLEAMMGTARPGAGAAERTAPVTSRGSRLPEFAAALARLGVIWARHGAAVARFRTRIGALLEQCREAPSAEASPAALLAEFDRFRERALRDWRTPIMNDFLLMLSHGALRRLAARWLGPDAAHLVNAVLADGSAASARPGYEMLRIASAIRANAAWSELVVGASPAELRTRLAGERGIPELASSIEAYLDAWGGRAPRELQLERPSYRDDPEPLMRALQALVRSAPPPLRLGNVEAAAQIRRRLRAASLGRLRAAVFMRLVRTVRRQVRWREELRLLRGGVFDVGRRIFRRLGVVLAAQGAVERPEDVHYLSLDELRGIVRGTGVVGDARMLVDARRRRYAGYASRPRLPARLETRGIVADPLSYVPIPTTDRSAPSTAATGSLRGIGAAPGRARASCLVILDPARSTIESGRIIAARSTDPGWVPLLVGAAGLLVEQGSLLSHSAIVARELGIPTVVGLAGLLDVVQTGDLIELDGSTGDVTLVARPGSDT